MSIKVKKETVGNKCNKEKLGLTPTYYVKTGFYLAWFFFIVLLWAEVPGTNKGFDHRVIIKLTNHQISKL